MPVTQYGVLVGALKDKLDSPSAMKKFKHGKPHYQLLLDVNGDNYRVAVNVKSEVQPVDLLFYLDDNYQNPLLDKFKLFQTGYTALNSDKDSGALDFVRMNLFDLNKMRVVPAINDPVSGNDLNDIFTVHLNQSQQTPGSLIYAFGSKWGPEANKPDQYFGFKPGNGIHDIHMNQGDKVMTQANGIYQDGALFIFYPDEPRWVAMFLRFQSQSINTDDNGNAK